MSLSDAPTTTGNSSGGGFSDDQAKVALALMSGVGATSVLVCAAGLLLAILGKLCSQLSYRLSSYPVAVALASGIVSGLEALFIREDEGISSGGDALCKAVAYLMQCSHLAKLTVSACLSFHLLAFSVCRKDYRKFEAGYVVLSLALPLMASAVPLITESYGRVAGTWCWIALSKDHGTVLQLSLWYGPAAVALISQCVSIVLVMTVTVWRERAEREKTTLLVTRRLKRKAISLVQIVPLLAYPIAWCVLVAPSVVIGIYCVISKKGQLEYGFLLTDALCTSAWSLTAGVILIIHVAHDAIATGRSGLGLSLSASVQESINDSSSLAAAHQTSIASYQRFHDPASRTTLQKYGAMN